ncbi:MAG: hypothetical protein QME05_04655 [Candidatus Margulisbacteria bacterium]|nr:hypothetical protein [Candidatus Margulisiibacteriota bacterium]
MFLASPCSNGTRAAAEEDACEEIPPFVLKFDEQVLEATTSRDPLVVDSSALKKSLEVLVSPNSEIRISVGGIYAVSYQTDTSGEVSVPFVEILRHIPIGKTEEVYIQNMTWHKSMFVARSTADITADPARAAQRSLQPLYEDIAGDLKAGKPVVITSHVVLWDADFTGEGCQRRDNSGNCVRRSAWADGNNFQTNLYWNWGGGVYRMFKESQVWSLVNEEQLADGPVRAVFKRTVKPNSFWQRLGIQNNFDVYAVFYGHTANNIVTGYASFANDLFGSAGEEIVLPGGTTITAGGQSRIVGFIGHLYYKGEEAIRQALAPISQKKGVFMATCLSAKNYADLVIQENAYGLLFGTDYMAPEGYIYLPLFQGIVEGQEGRGLRDRVRANYQASHPHESIPTSFFVNSTVGLERYLEPLEWDQDGDGLPNRIDPEPSVINQRVVETPN